MERIGILLLMSYGARNLALSLRSVLESHRARAFARTEARFAAEAAIKIRLKDLSSSSDAT